MSATPSLNVPPYGRWSLADLTPSLLSAAGVSGQGNSLELDPCRGFCLVLIDGLGHEQLLQHRDVAPFLAQAAERKQPLAAGFPSTTSASLASLGTGLPPGGHGLVGYTIAIPGHDRPMNTLLWELYGIGPHVELQTELVPEKFQPNPTVFERAADAGMAVVTVGPPAHEGSPLTRAIFRGGEFRGAYFFDEVRAVIADAMGEERPAVYAYHPDLDTTGHVHGAGSDPWREQLGRFDALIEGVATDLPDGCVLVVTGDHGMIRLEDKIDVADEPRLMDGVRLMAGDARARQLHVAPGAEQAVIDTWQEVLGERGQVVPREEAVESGWFGQSVSDAARGRIGDVIAAFRSAVGVVQRDVDPLYASLTSHHGSMTSAEQLVPFVEVRS
jgi:hypothetical protein